MTTKKFILLSLFINGFYVNVLIGSPAVETVMLETNIKVKPFVIKGLSESIGNAAKNLEIIQEAVQGCNQSKTGYLVFPKGVYPIGNEQTLKDMETLMTGKTSSPTFIKKNPAQHNIAMNFSQVKDLVIDGQGSTLVFIGLIQPFQINDCQNVLVKNLNIDWKRPLFTEGKVKMVKSDLFPLAVLEIEVFPEFPVKGGEPVVSFQNFSPATGHLSGVCQFTDISPLELVAPQTVRFTSSDGKFVKVGDVVIMRHIYNYGNGFDIINCSNIRIQDVTIYTVPGSGVWITRTNNITLKRYNNRPSGRRFLSIHGDAAHFISCTGTIEIDSCCFEGMGDDGTNVCSKYFRITERVDDRTVRAVMKDFPNYPDVGDEVEFVRMNTLFPYNKAKVIAVDFDPKKKESVIKFDRPLPDDFEMTDLISNISKNAKLIFTNNTVRDVRGRGILVQTRGALIENNRFEYCTGQGVHIDTAYPAWNESVGTRDVVIRNNTFLNCGFGNTTYCDAIGIVAETECKKPIVGVHRNLTIENNLIIGQSKPAFYLSCLDGAIIKGNRIISTGPAARLEYAVNVEFENNNFEENEVIIGLGCENRAIKKFENK